MENTQILFKKEEEKTKPPEHPKLRSTELLL